MTDDRCKNNLRCCGVAVLSGERDFQAKYHIYAGHAECVPSQDVP